MGVCIEIGILSMLNGKVFYENCVRYYIIIDMMLKEIYELGL